MYSPIGRARGLRYVAIPLLLALAGGMLPVRPAPAATLTVAIGHPGPSLPRGVHVLGSLPANTPMRLVVGLAPRRPELLKNFMQPRTTSASRRVLTPAEYAQTIGPTAADEEAVTRYLDAHSLRVVRHYQDRLLLDVAGTAGAVASAFGTTLVRYRDRHGHVYYANSTPPRVPVALAPLISAVVGLRNDLRPHYRPRPHAVALTRLSGVGGRRAHGIPSLPSAALTPPLIQAAYDITPLYTQTFTATTGLTTTATITGAGETIALFELSSYNQDDINTYDTAFGISSAPPISIPVDGGATDSYGESGAVETALDIELTRAVAPGARILVYNGPASQSSVDNTGVDDVYARIVNDDRAQVLSTSWGQCEDQQQADQPPDLMLLHNLFAQAVAEGMTIVAASGDNGAYDCLGADGSTPDVTKAAVDYPASDPYVIAVGGTQLTLAANGSVSSEEGWAGSGGGLSNYFPRPAWQTGPGVDNALSNGKRQVPDVALNAGTSYAVWVERGWQIESNTGTSAGAPVWAALLALGNQLRYVTAMAQGVAPPLCPTHPGLGDIHAQLYQLAATPLAQPAFRDITTGPTNGLAAPGPGWDYVTGLGVPDAYVLLRDLVALPSIAITPSSVCPALPWTPTPTPTPRATATRTPTAHPTPSPKPTAVKAASHLPAGKNKRDHLTVRVVPGQIRSGGNVWIELHGATGRGHPVLFEVDYPLRAQRIIGSTDRNGAVTMRIHVSQRVARGHTLLVRLHAIVHERDYTPSASTSFRIVS